VSDAELATMIKRASLDVAANDPGADLRLRRLYCERARRTVAQAAADIRPGNRS